jgi:glycosyltransferase involved in cell wall biosynthesis
VNILIVHRSYPPVFHEGGHTISLQQFAREFVSQGHSVTVCATNRDGHGRCNAGHFTENGVNIYKFPIKVLTRWSFAPDLFIFLRQRISQYDIVHIWSIFEFYSFVVPRLAEKYRIPLVVSPQGNFSPVAMRKNKLLKTIYLKILERNAFNAASAVHCMTKIDREWTCLQGIPNEKIFVVPNGIKNPPVSVPIHRHAVPNKYILFLGRIHPIKGLDFLIDVMAALPRSCDSVKLVLAGPDSDNYLKVILNRASQRGIGEKLVYIGTVGEAEKFEYIRRARFLVLPSYSENFGIVVVEAMFCGIPVVISDKCNVGIHVERAMCGFVIPHDIEKFCEKFTTLLNDEELCYKLGEAGLKYYQDNLTIESAATLMLNKYIDLIEQAKARQ